MRRPWGADGTAQLWDAHTGDPVGRPWEHGVGTMFSIAFSPDGKMALTGGVDGRARLWDVATGKPTGWRVAEHALVWLVAFSPDGKSVLLAMDRVARRWDIDTAQSLGLPMEHSSPPWAAAFSPDGRTVLTGCFDGTARFWDVATSRPLGPPMRHQATILALAFSPDGKMALTGSRDGEVRVWPTVTLPDDLEHVAIWVEALTGLTLDESGSIRPLDRDTWLRRRAEAERQGNQPLPGSRGQPATDGLPHATRGGRP